MPYATVQDLIDFAGEVEVTRNSTPEGADFSGPWPERVQPKLDTASDLMDSYFRRRYQVPVPVSPIIRDCCCTLARYLLASGPGGGPPESVRLAHKTSTAWLENIGRGTVNLDGVVGVVAGPPSGARYNERPRVFDNRSPLR